MIMVQNKDETSEWLYKTVCADYEQYAILSFKVVELQRHENVLDVSFEFYALETKKLGAHGLFKLDEFPESNESFPHSVHYLRWKAECIFENTYDCENLGSSGRFEFFPSVSEVTYDWRDIRIPESFIADLFDYRCADSIGLKIIKRFNLLDMQSSIPDCIPPRLIPHLKKSITAYRILLG
jgi:hypothetical protein